MNVYVLAGCKCRGGTGSFGVIPQHRETVAGCAGWIRMPGSKWRLHDCVSFSITGCTLLSSGVFAGPAHTLDPQFKCIQSGTLDIPADDMKKPSTLWT